MIIGIYYFLLSWLRYHILQDTYGGAYIAKFVSSKTGTSFDSRVVDLTWGLRITEPRTVLGYVASAWSACCNCERSEASLLYGEQPSFNFKKRPASKKRQNNLVFLIFHSDPQLCSQNFHELWITFESFRISQKLFSSMAM
jgi:hypothetical protein